MQQDPDDDVLLPPPDYSDTPVRRNSTKSLIQTRVSSSENTNTVSSSLLIFPVYNEQTKQVYTCLLSHQPFEWQQQKAEYGANSGQEFPVIFTSGIKMRRKKNVITGALVILSDRSVDGNAWL